MNKKIIGVLFLFISLVSLLSLHFLSFNNKLPEVRLKEIINKNKSFAIMIQEKSETDKYQEYSSNTWPGDDYVFKEAKCIDSKGDEIKEAVTYEEGKITLTTNKTVYCTVYFDKSIIGKLREKDPNKVLSTEEVGGMYRYQGVGTEEGVDATHKLVDNNYICFGTNDINKCNCNTEENCDKYMYRIIGVTKDNQLYLIKMKGVKEGDNNRFHWNSKSLQSECIENTCEWPNSDLYKRLNGASSNGNPVFTNNQRYDYLIEKNPWYSKIESRDWTYGDIDYSISSIFPDGETIYGLRNNGQIIYDIEIGLKSTQHLEKNGDNLEYIKTNWKDKKVNAKIGLMYLHDYYLAYDNETIWYGKYDANNWILFVNNKDTTNYNREWIISSEGATKGITVHQYFIYSDGHIDSTEPNIIHVTRPTFYLSNDIQITGSGEIDNPYLINIK